MSHPFLRRNGTIRPAKIVPLSRNVVPLRRQNLPLRNTSGADRLLPLPRYGLIVTHLFSRHRRHPLSRVNRHRKSALIPRKHTSLPHSRQSRFVSPSIKSCTGRVRSIYRQKRRAERRRRNVLKSIEKNGGRTQWHLPRR